MVVFDQSTTARSDVLLDEGAEAWVSLTLRGRSVSALPRAAVMLPVAPERGMIVSSSRSSMLASDVLESLLIVSEAACGGG